MLVKNLKPFVLNSDATLFSTLPLEKVLKQVEVALNIPDFDLDTSGDYEDEEVYLSSCLGLEIFLAKDDGASDRYHVSVFTSRNAFDYDEVDAEDLNWDHTLLAMLSKAGLTVRERRLDDEPD